MKDNEYRNRRDREVWEAREDIRAASKVGRSVGWRVGVTFLVVLGISVVISIGALLFRAGTSDVKGQLDSTIQKNSAANRLEAQRSYTKLYEGIQAADKKINNMATTARSEMDRENVVQTTNVCLESVAEYNRMATDVLTRDFRPELYPERVGETRDTDCLPDTNPTPSATR